MDNYAFVVLIEPTFLDELARPNGGPLISADSHIQTTCLKGYEEEDNDKVTMGVCSNKN